MIEFDIVLDEIGHFGIYQLQIFSMVYWIGVPAGMNTLAAVFYSAPVPYRCNVPPIDNGTIYSNLSEAQILYLTTPYDQSSKRYDTCSRYGYDLELCDGGYDCVNKSAPHISCDMGYHFDTSIFTNTIATEWNLVCDLAIINTVANSVFFAGMFAGALISGHISDNYGRRTALCYCNLGTFVFGLIATFSPWFTLFTIARFFVAATSHGSNLALIIYVMEVSGKHRTPAGMSAHIPFSVGYMLLSLISYFFRNWRHYYFAITLFSLPYLVFHYFIPESPRWLFAKGHHERGKEVCYKFAHRNGKALDESTWSKATTTRNCDQRRKRHSSVDLFRPYRMRLITLNVMFSWFVASLVYFGLALNVGTLSGSIFVNNCLNGCSEIIAAFFIIPVMDRCGRVPLLFTTFIIAGLALIGNMFCKLFGNGGQAIATTGVALALTGKLFASAAFGVAFNFTAELYPTMLRSNGMGVGSMAARFGSILSPFVILINHSHPWFLGTIFGTLSLLAGLLALLFPETMNKSMPHTMEEAKVLYGGRSVDRAIKTPENGAGSVDVYDVDVDGAYMISTL